MIAKRYITKLDESIPKLAVLIGIGYPNTKIEMSDPYDDLHRMISCLINYGFRYQDIILLTDSDAFDIKILPTSTNIMEYITDMVKFANQYQDIPHYIVFYYTGHGLRFMDKIMVKQAIVPSNYHEVEYISGELIKQKLVDELPAMTNLLLIFDCCYSGNIINLKYRYDTKNNKYINNIDDISKCNAYLLCSSRYNQVSLKQLTILDKYNREKRSMLTWAYFEKYKSNSYFASLLKNMQIFIDMKFSNQYIELYSNMDIDINTTYFI